MRQELHSSSFNKWVPQDYWVKQFKQHDVICRMFARTDSIWLHCSLFINKSFCTGTASHIFDDESCSFLGKAMQIHQSTRNQHHKISMNWTIIAWLRDRADWRDKARRNFPEIQETKEDMDLGGNEKCMFPVVHHLILERVLVLLWVCLWPIQIIVMYTCMLKIISPPFYCAVMLMDSCVTFYFHYNFCQEHEKSKFLSHL